jgi:hypothetical protein
VSRPFFTPGFVYPALQRPPTVFVTRVYLTPFMGSTPIGARLPKPSDDDDTVNGFLRVEAGGGTKANLLEFNMSIILHAYSPYQDQAEDISDTAMGWMTAAEGQSIAGWSVTRVCGTVEKHVLADPNVQKLTRYRSMVTWRMPGRVLAPPGS